MPRTDADWRDALLATVEWAPESTEPPVNRVDWPDYVPRRAVRWGRATIGSSAVIIVCWDFDVLGGSFGELDAGAFLAAVDASVRARRPLISLLRSGGTRLQEGVAGLVGMARATIGVHRLAEAGIPHIAVADQPTTGGVWVTLGSRADLRCAVDGAIVGFAGPRVVEAVTGELPGPDSHTAASAFHAGLVDALVKPSEVTHWLDRALAAFESPHVRAVTAPSVRPLPERDGWEQVQAARRRPGPDAAELLAALLDDAVAVRGSDDTVSVAVGRLAASDQPVIAAAVGSRRGGRPTPAGYRLLKRAAQLASRFELPLLTLIDTPGAEPGPAAERDGLAAAIGEAMDAVLTCRAATVGVLIGEGGSGGALAAACCDALLVGPDSYLAALAPEGAARALRRPADEVARLYGLRPVDLLALGLADAAVPGPESKTFGRAIAAAIAKQSWLEPARRQSARERRWSGPLTGTVTET
ncbi:MAG TPA: carboxyl transferase domain-containing protein [Frankiaceae bacterium]|jgi:acetyl-CoA carboxylase carboxyl transferase subunit beta|nr:carboxyl transferase domain-containing protein [Frankiaceae bacterium]